MDLNELIGKTLKRIRTKNKMTQVELAKLINVDSTYIGKWENGTLKLSLENAMKICEVLDVDLNIFLEIQNIDEERFYPVPVLGDIKCGIPMYADEQVSGYKMIPFRYKRRGEYFYLRAKGDSMIDLNIEEGDYLLMKRTTTLEENEIGAFLFKGEESANLKIFKKGKDGIKLCSANKNYKDIVIPKEEVHNLMILAKLEQIDKRVYNIKDIINDEMY